MSACNSYAGESAQYGQAVLLGLGEPCRRRVFEQLVELRRRAGEYLLSDGVAAEDEYFFAEQNAAVVANAEEYYRTMFSARGGSWNLRDRHMADTLDQLLAHLSGDPASHPRELRLGSPGFRAATSPDLTSCYPGPVLTA